MLSMYVELHSPCSLKFETTKGSKDLSHQDETWHCTCRYVVLRRTLVRVPVYINQPSRSILHTNYNRSNQTYSYNIVSYTQPQVTTISTSLITLFSTFSMTIFFFVVSYLLFQFFCKNDLMGWWSFHLLCHFNNYWVVAAS